jgi:hypothetical protein
LPYPPAESGPIGRDLESETLQSTVDWPVDGILFDVENNDYWCQDWGMPPADVGASVRVACEQLARVPKVVPLFSHRCVPTVPHEPGNPVLVRSD